MEADGGLVAGSHNRNELVVIRQTLDSEEVRFNYCIPNFRNLAVLAHLLSQETQFAGN